MGEITFMEHLRQLLETENSQLAQLLRFSLYGLEATLKQAQAELPLDPGAELCDEVLQELDSLLQLTSGTSGLLDSGGELKLHHLREVFLADPELTIYLGQISLHSRTDADLWNEIHRYLLRLPEDLATSWQQKALELAQEVGAIANPTNLYPLPFLRDEIIYPGLSGTVQAAGLCLSKKELPPLPNLPGNQIVDLDILFAFLHLYEKLTEIEPNLHHALRNVFSFDVVSLHSKPEQRNQYLEALSDRIQRVQKAEEHIEPILILRAWIDFDEAVNSLVFIPPAERYSWWGKLHQESRRLLKKVADRAAKAGHNVRIRNLSGLYADICNFSKDDLQLDCGGTPGEVLTCLRMYARINQEECPGRVLFRSSR